MMVESEDLAGVAELAQATGASAQSLCNYAKRYPSFPAPVLVLSRMAIYSRTAVVAWYAAHIERQAQAVTQRHAHLVQRAAALEAQAATLRARATSVQ